MILPITFDARNFMTSSDRFPEDPNRPVTGGSGNTGDPYGSPKAQWPNPADAEQSPVLVFVLGLVTCGIYVLYWYYSRYQTFKAMTGRTPTGNSFALDFLLILVTCSIWHVYMDYRISMQLNDLQKEVGLPENDTTTLTVLLDVAGYLTGYVTGLVSTAIHQDQLNKVLLATPPGRASV